jgi:tRNA pseudouridine55 synthase
MGVGRATRLLRFLGDLPKVYAGTLRLGVETATLDAEGDVTRESPVGEVTDEEIDRAMAAKLGTSPQRPPAFSAVKVGGRTLHEAARKGELIEAPARLVRVDRFERTERSGDDVSFVCEVGGGTYVRVLAADVGAALGYGAHLVALRRTAIGPFLVDGATDPGDPGAPLPIEQAVTHLPRFALEHEEAIAASHGRILGPAAIDGPYGVYDPGGSLIGVYRDDGGKARPLVILAPA